MAAALVTAACSATAGGGGEGDVAGITGVVILSPDDLATVTSPVRIVVEARGEAETTVADGGQLVAFVNEDCPASGSAVDGAPLVMADGSIDLTLDPGVHTVCIQTIDAAGQAAWAVDERTLTVE